MLTTETINELLGISESYQAPAKMLEIMLDDERRAQLFDAFLEVEWRVDYEWFLDYFQDEHADRKGFKQDFTPDGVATLLAHLTAGSKKYFEVAAGTGTLLIKTWNEHRFAAGPANFDPRTYWYHAEELSDRAVPFLLFNMALRGMNGVVLHGDALTREFKNVYFIRNDSADFMAYSEVIKMEQTDALMQELDIQAWTT